MYLLDMICYVALLQQLIDMFTYIYRLTASVFIVIAPGSDIEVIAQVFTIVGEIILLYAFHFTVISICADINTFTSWIFWHH
jgi:hypothetical protein